jgi:tRNA G18 (ribose-2'-O)-methylase SpoU
MSEIVVLAHNIRSIHNIGSIFRTCEGFGVRELVLSGYSPYPSVAGDTRLPHISAKLTAAISKTALGAERLVPFTHSEDALATIREYKTLGYTIVGLEQAPDSTPLPQFGVFGPVLLILGEEVAGITLEILALCDRVAEIPMFGQKESFNVSVAAGIALYQITCIGSPQTESGS